MGCLNLVLLFYQVPHEKNKEGQKWPIIGDSAGYQPSAFPIQQFFIAENFAHVVAYPERHQALVEKFYEIGLDPLFRRFFMIPGLPGIGEQLEFANAKQ